MEILKHRSPSPPPLAAASAPAGARPAPAAPAAQSRATQDSLALSKRPPVRPKVHVDLKDGAHADVSAFRQQLRLGVDSRGVTQDLWLLGIKERLDLATTGVDAHLSVGHSEASAGLSTSGANGMVDTLGIRLEGGASHDGLMGSLDRSDQGLVVPLGFTGDEVILQDDGTMNLRAKGVSAGINLLSGEGAHVGYSRFGVGAGLSDDHGGSVEAHVGSHRTTQPIRSVVNP